jgi:hypothetical protein
LGLSERYEAALDILRISNPIPISTPRVIITGILHLGGGETERKIFFI